MLKQKKNTRKHDIITARVQSKNRQKVCRLGEEMYRKQVYGQIKLDIPFGVPLDINNRWVKLAGIMPWEKIEERYGSNFGGERGQVAKSGRLAFGALYIQGRLGITDEETVSQIQENPSMQYFCGYECYTPEKPFDSSLMVHFRKRITAEMMKEITEEAFAAEALRAIEKEKDDNDDGGSGEARNDDSTNESEPKGTMLLDATCCPSDIHYPTDVHLLNHARELTEEIIDVLHEQAPQGEEKPRTYRKVARKVYLAYAKKRRNTSMEIRFVIRRQLQYIRRNLDTIGKQIDSGASLVHLNNELYRKLLVVSELYRQQKLMYDEKIHKVDDRIVSIAQPHVRPIVRGKASASVEFGAKVATARIGGFVFIIHMEFDNFSEAVYLEKAAEEYKRIFGFYPKTIIGDKAYGTNSNRNYCKSKGIRLSALKRGRQTEEARKAEKKQLYDDGCKRNAIEGDYGITKRKFGLDLVMTKLFNTTMTAISFGFFIKNMERVLRFFVLLYTYIIGIIWKLFPRHSPC